MTGLISVAAEIRFGCPAKNNSTQAVTSRFVLKGCTPFCQRDGWVNMRNPQYPSSVDVDPGYPRACTAAAATALLSATLLSATLLSTGATTTGTSTSDLSKTNGSRKHECNRKGEKLG